MSEIEKVQYRFDKVAQFPDLADDRPGTGYGEVQHVAGMGIPDMTSRDHTQL